MVQHAFITAGSAVTMLDQVRHVEIQHLKGTSQPDTEFWFHEMQNIFHGDLGIMLAEELLARGIPTTLLIRKESASRVKAHPSLDLRTFRTFDDLERELALGLEQTKPDLVFMSAAPPDYAPKRLEGKMSSDADEITITYHRTPKLITSLRATLGDKAFIVGFKLLVGVSEETMYEVGSQQISRADTDMCVGNDLTRIDRVKKLHPMQLIFRDGSQKHIQGFKTDIARTLVAEVLGRIQE
jgi:phosphopantothenoylcysteine synthetase/decarboxylase